MHGLMRVVLIDSFITGKRVFVDTDGHTTVNGRNGSGKTSFLKLLSIFYGAEPRQVENKAGGKDSFVDWYLPRSTSLIIYEYERVDGLCCLVLYRHPTAGTAKPAYRFMKGAFTPERFSVLDSTGAPVFCRGRELRAHWQSQALTFSRQIEIVTDFRAIIQNDTVLLRRSTMAAESKRLARDYSLGDGCGTMQHIEKVCTAIQNQHSNLERMKDMLADIMFREGVVIPEPPRHPENFGIANRVRWLTSFDKELPGIRTTLLQNGDRRVRQLAGDTLVTLWRAPVPA
ncbi:MAG: ATP-binding protein [Sedimenticola sp.]